MKRVILIIALITSMANSRANAQIADVKFNVAAAAVAIFNPSVEFGFCENSAVTMDYLGAYAKGNYMGTGYPFMFSMIAIGYRHYLVGEDHTGLFLGADIGFTNFVTNKNITPFIHGGYPKEYYDLGTGKLAGLTVGYKLPIKERWMAEFSVSAGWHHCWHEGYNVIDGLTQVIEKMSKSAEWVPYKASVSLSYRLFE